MRSIGGDTGDGGGVPPRFLKLNIFFVKWSANEASEEAKFMSNTMLNVIIGHNFANKTQDND